MNVLIIGGSKFIGLHLVRELDRLNYKVTVFNIEESSKMLPSRVTHIIGDRKKPWMIKSLLKNKNFDIVFDTCGFKAPDIEICIDLFKHKIGQYIYCSTVSVYDFRCIKKLPINEKFPIKKKPYSKCDEVRYGSNKALCEQALLSNGYFPVTIFRPSYVYGPCAYDNRVESFLKSLSSRKEILIPPIRDNVVHFVHVLDLARLFVAAIGKSKAYNKIYNAAGREIVNMYEFIKLCGYAVGVKTNIKTYELERLSNFIAKEDQDILIPIKIYPFSLCFDISKALTELSWEPKIDLLEGLKNTYEWYKRSEAYKKYYADGKAVNI